MDGQQVSAWVPVIRMAELSRQRKLSISGVRLSVKRSYGAKYSQRRIIMGPLISKYNRSLIYAKMAFQW